MKNKKLIALLAILTLTAALTACGSNTDTANRSTAGTENKQQTEAKSLGAGLGDDTKIVDYDYLYGKISNITGNEIQLSLVEMPEVEAATEKEGDQNNITDIPQGAAAATVPAQTIDSAEGGGSVELTGETVTLTIPAGVKFNSMGQESTMSALKKGSLISVTVDNLENMNIYAVDIIE